MATEIGAKAVDAGSRQFDDATNSFRRIAQLVATTSDATREIELSTKQQSTAVEQVNVAASDTARVTRETEASAVQTKQTAAHLSSLVLACQRDGELVYAGKVGSGLSGRSSRQIQGMLTDIDACVLNETPPPSPNRTVHWTVPSVVARVCA